LELGVEGWTKEIKFWNWSWGLKPEHGAGARSWSLEQGDEAPRCKLGAEAREKSRS